MSGTLVRAQGNKNRIHFQYVAFNRLCALVNMIVAQQHGTMTEGRHYVRGAPSTFCSLMQAAFSPAMPGKEALGCLLAYRVLVKQKAGQMLDIANSFTRLTLSYCMCIDT